MERRIGRPVCCRIHVGRVVHGDQAESGQGVVGLVCGVIGRGIVGRESAGGVELAARPQAGGLPQFFARPAGVALAMQASRYPA